MKHAIVQHLSVSVPAIFNFHRLNLKVAEDLQTMQSWCASHFEYPRVPDSCCGNQAIDESLLCGARALEALSLLPGQLLSNHLFLVEGGCSDVVDPSSYSDAGLQCSDRARVRRG